MNSFATIVEFARYNTVSFYTFKGEGSTFSEAEDFFIRIQAEIEYSDQLEQLIAWMDNIGDHKDGAQFNLFRSERNCVALPPGRKHLKEQIDLRIYCHWVSEQVVILYNGGIKTANSAQHCPNVSRHFYNAQSWTKQLKDIGIETNGQTITNIDELYLKY